MTKNSFLLEAIVNSTSILFDALLSRIVGQEILFLCFSFAVPSTTRSPLVDDVVRDWESIESPLVKITAAIGQNVSLILCQSKNVHKLIPTKKASEQRNSFTLPISRIIAFESLLDGL